MDFLVRVETCLPPELPEARRAELLRCEAERGRMLQESGVLRQIWRIPGRLANVGIWRAATAEELHEALTSLPVWPYAHITVTALAAHPLSPSA
jgi:muconolactone D-isomerase